MTKERISSAELAQRKEEYYELLATSDSSLREVLNQRGGLVLARVGRYQPWPARFCEPGEFAKMARYRAKKGQACVYFFGSRNYGWVSKSSIQPFPEDLTTLTGSAKYNQALIQEALDEAKFVLDVTDETGRRFFDRIMERKEEAVDLPCERCNRVDDHYSLLILCDGKNCKREYHMNCLSPPLESIPPGDWFCPDCEKDQEKEREKEREKEQLKRAKAEAMDKQDASVTEVNAVDGELPVAKTPSAKKVVKKHKLKSRDGTAKRRLASTSPDRVGVSVKKPRAGRSSSREVSPPPRTTPKRLDGRKKKPSQLSIPSSRAQLLSDPESGTADDEQQSEEKCLLCGFGGELIVCEFPACTKVYHQFCLGAYPFPKDEDATWYCPRHTCVLTGEKELCEDGEKTTNKLKHASPRKVNVKNVLWKCNQCPLAIAEEALPQLPQGQIFSKKSRTFMCPNCYLNAPAKVQLAKRLEKIWSTLATNRQGMPFCGPLLCGVEPVDGSENATGDQVKKMDVLANEVFINSLKFSTKIEVMVSEEEVEPVCVDNISSEGTKYCIAFDPLDGSSNIDCNVSTGTIFGIYHRDRALKGGYKDILQPGNQLVAAGYCMYGSSTQLVLTWGRGVHCFTLDPTVGAFILSNENMKIPENPKTIYSVNEGHYAHWDRASKAFVDECKNKPTPYNARYVGSMVSDIHRTILYGGIYMYPGTDKNKEGKLRLLYEGNPMSFIMEQAGGMSTTGTERVLDLCPTDIHQRSPIFLGCKRDVQRVIELYKQYGQQH